MANKSKNPARSQEENLGSQRRTQGSQRGNTNIGGPGSQQVGASQKGSSQSGRSAPGTNQGSRTGSNSTKDMGANI